MLFTGRLTANADVTNVKGDKKVTNFTVALNQRFKTKAGEKKERTAFIECAYWVNPGLADYLTKGAIVEISGWVEAQYWTDREGKVHPRLNCNVDTIKLFSAAPKQAAEQTTAKANKNDRIFMGDAVAAVDNTGMNDDDDLPF
jgi:single-strand DNA-binding protein